MKKLFSLLSVSVFVLGLFFTSPVSALSMKTGCADFIDVSATSPFCDAIEYVTDRGVFEGYSSGSFGPSENINRAEILKVILTAFDPYRTFDVNSVDVPGLGFSDIPWSSKEWWYPYLKRAMDLGMVKGYPDGTYGGWKSVSRVEFLKMFLEGSPYKTQVQNWNVKSYQLWADTPASAWFAKYIAFANHYGLLASLNYCQGNNACPGDKISRAEVAQVMYNYHKYLGQNIGFPDGELGLTTPSLKYPLNNAVYGNSQNVDVPFSWDSVNNASYYRVMIRLSGSSSYFVDAKTTSTSYNYYFNIKNANLGYFWKVRAYDANGKYKDSEERYLSFGSTESLTSPTLLYPSNATQYTNTKNWTIQYSWQPVTGAAYYRVMTHGDSANASFVDTSGIVYSTNYSQYMNTLNSNFTYYWKVRAYDSNGNYKDSAVRYFTFGSGSSVLSIPVLYSPSNGATVAMTTGQNVDFFWYTSPEVDNYTFMLRQDTSSNYLYSYNVSNMGVKMSHSYFFQKQTGGYYWKIRAYDSNGNYKDSEEYLLNLATSNLGASTLLAPENGKDFIGTVVAKDGATFSWAPASYAVKYDLMILWSGNVNYSTIYTWNSASAVNMSHWVKGIYFSSFQNTYGFHYWKVRAYDSTGNYKDSAVRSFKTQVLQ